MPGGYKQGGLRDKYFVLRYDADGVCVMQQVSVEVKEKERELLRAYFHAVTNFDEHGTPRFRYGDVSSMTRRAHRLARELYRDWGYRGLNQP